MPNVAVAIAKINEALDALGEDVPASDIEPVYRPFLHALIELYNDVLVDKELRDSGRYERHIQAIFAAACDAGNPT